MTGGSGAAGTIVAGCGGTAGRAAEKLTGGEPEGGGSGGGGGGVGEVMGLPCPGGSGGAIGPIAAGLAGGGAEGGGRAGAPADCQAMAQKLYALS